MLKLPKGLKKKKKGKKSKRKGEDELFTEEELEQYRREHQQQQEQQEGEGSKENEEWSKFKDLTTGIDSVLKKSQGDLDRIKSSSFFQRIPAGARQVDRAGVARATPPPRPAAAPAPAVHLTAADFPHLHAQLQREDDDDHSECLSDDDDDDDDQEDIFDTSYVEAVERGEVKLAYVPDSPDIPDDDDIFDTSHVDKLIKGQEAKTSKGKKALDIGVAVEVLTGRIDNVQLPSSKRPSKRVIPGDLLLEGDPPAPALAPAAPLAPEPQERSILDVYDDLPPAAPIDLSVSLHPPPAPAPPPEPLVPAEEEDDEFTQLAAESLEVNAAVRLADAEIHAEPVLQEAWSAFEADKNVSVFAEGIVEDQLDADPYLGQDDPFDTSFADAVVPPPRPPPVRPPPPVLSDEEEFLPRGARLNNRRKSSVRIHLTDPAGLRESITSDDVAEPPAHDLLGGSCSDLSQLATSPLAPAPPADTTAEFDPFDTSQLESAAAPGPRELRLLERELNAVAPAPVYRVPSDPDFDPRADEPVLAPAAERRASRPENLVCKSVGFAVSSGPTQRRAPPPATPYYSRERSIGEDSETLPRTHSEEELAARAATPALRRHSALPTARAQPLLDEPLTAPHDKVLTPHQPHRPAQPARITDPFDTSFAAKIAPSRVELRLLAKEFSCEEVAVTSEPDLLEPEDDLFQVKALSPEPTHTELADDVDPFDTSFATDLQPGRTELKLLESEFLH